MNDLEQLLETALVLEKQGDKEESLIVLSQAFDSIIDKAGEYARAQESDTTDLEALRAIAPRLIEHSNAYLRTNLTAAMILNNMGLLFMELQQYEAALQKFEEAVRLTPLDTEYDDPTDNIQQALMKIAELTPAPEENTIDG